MFEDKYSSKSKAEVVQSLNEIYKNNVENGIEGTCKVCDVVDSTKLPEDEVLGICLDLLQDGYLIQKSDAGLKHGGIFSILSEIPG